MLEDLIRTCHSDHRSIVSVEVSEGDLETCVKKKTTLTVVNEKGKKKG